MPAVFAFFVRFAAKGPISLLIAIVLCVALWYWGDRVALLSPWRLHLIVLIAVAWVLYASWLAWSAWSRRRRMAAVLAAPVGEILPSNPLDALDRQFAAAAQAMEGTKLSRAALDALPWYLMLGPPGSGKTAALRESGLNFPHVGLGYRAHAGAGGTRSCDFWFAEQGVFVDTCGGYATEATRQGEWAWLLALLAKRTSRAQPLSGVVVVVAITDLLALSEDQVDDYAQALRDRLDELTARLGLSLPVYLMFSKCDLLHGFSEFFAQSSLEDRMQVWGTSVDPAEFARGSVRDRVDAECRKLYDALRTRRVEALSQERTRDEQQRALLFPIQFTLLQSRLGLFIEPLVRANPFQDSAQVRGFYFTSAAQSGTPVDLTANLLGRLIADGATPTPLAAGEQRAFFLKGVFSQVLPPDRTLARASRQALARNRRLRAMLAAASLVIGVGLCAWWLVGYRRGAAALAQLPKAQAAFALAGADRAAGLKALDGLRLRLQDISGSAGIPLPLRAGMALGPDVAQRAQQAYVQRLRDWLQRPFAERLRGELVARLRQGDKTLRNYEVLYDLHRGHLMLSGVIPLERAVIDRLLVDQGRWTRAVEGTVEAPTVTADANEAIANQQLVFALTSLPLAQWGLTPDRPLIETLNRELKEAHWIPLSSVEIVRGGGSLYPAIGRSSLVAGGGVALIALEHEINGLYSQAGWDSFVAPAVRDSSRQLSRKFADLGIDLGSEQVASRLRDQYVTDYIRAWRSLALKLGITPFSDLSDAVEQLAVLGGPVSPYREAFATIWRSQVISLGGNDIRNAPTDQLDWLDAALKPIGTFQITLAAYTTAKPAGTRLADPAALDQLLAAFVVADQAVMTALETAPDPDLRKSVGRALRQALGSARQQLERELYVETVTAAAAHMRLDHAQALVTALNAVPSSYPQQWQKLVEGAALSECGNLEQASAKLAFLASPQSPLRHLLRSAWQGQGVVGAAPPAPAGWLDQCLTAVQAAQGACAALSSADPQQRLFDTASLKKFADTMNSAQASISSALSAVDQPVLFRSANRLFTDVLDQARHCAVNTMSEDANRLWREGFYDAYTTQCAKRFPFTTEAEAEQLEPQVFARLFGGKSGSLWRIAAALEASAAITVLGRPLLPLSPATREALVAAQRLKGLLYRSDSADVLGVPLAVRFLQRAGINDMRLTAGGASVGLYDTPDRTARLMWTQDGPASSQISIIVEDDRRLSVSFNDQPWSLLRLIASGRPVPHPQGGVLLTWELGDAARLYVVQVVLEVGLPDGQRLLSTGLLAPLSLPAQVVP
jgi:type VI secretion system IcmF/VasK family protein